MVRASGLGIFAIHRRKLSHVGSLNQQRFFCYVGRRDFGRLISDVGRDLDVGIVGDVGCGNVIRVLLDLEQQRDVGRQRQLG